MAYLDIACADIAIARRRKDDEAMCYMAQAFYSRFMGLEGERTAIRSYDCTGVKLHDSGFRISFSDGKHLHFANRGERWLVSEHDDSTPGNFDSHVVAVHRFGAPFAFLEGIQFCMECIQEAERSKSASFLESHKDSLRSEVERLEARVDFLNREARKLERISARYDKKFHTPKFIADCREKAVAASCCKDDPPNPPESTVACSEARHIFDGIPGIYFLWNGNKIEYVGRANCIGSRLSRGHHKADPDVHRVSAVRVDSAESWLVEPYYIWRFEPPLNSEAQKAAARRSVLASTAQKKAQGKDAHVSPQA